MPFVSQFNVFARRKKHLAVTVPTLALAIVPVLFGCDRRPKDPLETVVEAGSPLELQRWRARVADDLKPEQTQDVDTAIQELKFQLMAQGVSGTAAIDTAIDEKVKNKTTRQVIELGLTAKLDRLEQQQAAINTFIAQNAMLVTRGGDAASADYLARKRDEQVARRDALAQEAAGVRERMKTDGITPPPPKATPPADDSKPAGTAEERPDTMPQLEHK
jgi:hypothetical protein